MVDLALVREGITDFFVPASLISERKGPAKRVKYGFYNPAMEESRDISVAVAQVLVDSMEKKVKILDGLSSIGARGLRIAKEVDGEFEVVLNDWNCEAINIAKKSIDYNNLSNVKINCENLNILLCKERFDYIDVDPFGSPVPYVSMAVRSVNPNGILAFTATDTATLCGVYKKTCQRRYSSTPLRTWCMHEIGLRILIGYIVREGARFDISLHPILSYSREYYMRVYFRVRKGAKQADRTLENIGTIEAYDFDLNRKKVGPLWIGDLHDKCFLISLEKVIKEKNFGCAKSIKKLIDRCLDEIGMPPLFYDINVLSSIFRKSPPKIHRMMKLLREEGYRVSRTHFRDTAFKSNANIDEIIKTFKDLTI